MTNDVMIGLACPHGNVPPRLHEWLRLHLPARLGEDLVIARIDGEAEVAYANNLLVEALLRSKYSRLWLVAADLVPYAETHTILDADADVACGVSYVRQADPDDPTGCYVGPNVVRWLDESVWSWQQLPWELIGERPIEQVGGGMHCTVIRREVFGLPGVELAPGAWFRTLRDARGMRTLSDDTDFCHRVLAAGGRVTAYPRALSGHLKHVDIGAVWRTALARGRREALEEVA